jgi:hypothetical protein
VADVARQRVDGSLLSIECQRGKTRDGILDPELLTEPCRQRGSPAAPVIAARPAEQVEPALVDVLQKSVPFRVGVVPQQPSAASSAGASASTSPPGRPQHQASCSKQIHSGVASTVP